MNFEDCSFRMSSYVDMKVQLIIPLVLDLRGSSETHMSAHVFMFMFMFK